MRNYNHKDINAGDRAISSFPKSTILQPSRIRPYQNGAIREITNSTKDAIREKLNIDAIFPNALLLEMATWSGKTFTVGRYLEHIIRMRDRHKVLRNTMSGLKVVLLSNRIDGVSQFRDDLFHGRGWEYPKPPILSPDIRANITISTYHSWKDGDDLHSREGYIEQENIWARDEFICITPQTAQAKWLADILEYVDIIFIDEAHNIKKEGEFYDVVTSLNNKGRNRNTPLIVPLTATPSNITKRLFGDPKYTFGLADYLASWYAPRVRYEVVTNMKSSQEHMKQLELLIAQAKTTNHIWEKKELLRVIDEHFENMQMGGNIPEFISDLIARAWIKNKNGENQLEETVIFTSSIKEANTIATYLDPKKSWYALAYHSENDLNNAISKLRNPDDPCKVIIAVDKLNESIDLPVVKNVVFYRSTMNAKIYLQQFGRWLRGDGIVNYYDYVAGLRNFVWLGNIYQEYQQKKRSQKNNSSWSIQWKVIYKMGEQEESDDEFSIQFGQINGEWFEANFGRIGIDINNIQQEIKASTTYTKKNIQEWLLREYGSIGNLMRLSQNEIKTMKYEQCGYINKIAAISGWSGSENVQTRAWFQAWLCWIYEIERKDLTKKDIQEWLLKEYGSIGNLMRLSHIEMKTIEHENIGKISSLVALSGWNGRENPRTPKWFQAWIKWLFEWEEEKHLTKKDIQEWLLRKYGSLEQLLMLSKNEISFINHERGGKITSLVKLSGWENKKEFDSQIPKWFQAWIKWLFDLNEIQIRQIKQQYLKDWLLEKYNSIEVLMMMSSKNIKNIKHERIGAIIGLTRFSNWTNKEKMDVQIPLGFQTWIKWLFNNEQKKKD